MNQGYLDADEYLPSIRKAWKAACDAVSKEGALGWVQPIADKPGHYSGKDTEVYGAGAYLMAGSELRKYVIGRDHPQKKTVTVTNPWAGSALLRPCRFHGRPEVPVMPPAFAF